MVEGEGGLAKEVGGDDRRTTRDAIECGEAVVMVKGAVTEEWAGWRSRGVVMRWQGDGGELDAG